MKNKFSFTRLVFTAFFLCLFALFLYIANLVVYRMLVIVFGIYAPVSCVILAAALGVLSASFLISTLIGMRAYNLFTRWYYLISSVWIGFFAYLFLACVLYGVLIALVGGSLIVFGKILICGAFLASIYAIFHARNMIVKYIKIFLPDLPREWRGRKAVWISDLHIGQLYDHKFTQKIVDTVNAIEHDIVFIGGDLYDGTEAPDIVRSTLPLGKFKAPLGIYFITGNHEEFGDNTKFIQAVRSAGIRTLIDQVVEIDGLQIIGVDYRNVLDSGKIQECARRPFF